jgi:hypothetical protein
MNNHTYRYEVFRIPGKFLKNQAEEKMPTSFPADDWGFNEASKYAALKLNDRSNISCEIDGDRRYYANYVIRKTPAKS